MNRAFWWMGLGLLLTTGAWASDSITIEVRAVTADGVGDSIGTIRAKANPHGVLLEPELTGLDPGVHGFHLHENPSCDPAEKDGKAGAALAAGGHLDPKASGAHSGPYADGHLGDLPPLFVDAKGMATTPLLAPRLEIGSLHGRSLVIHAGGDNFSDEPEKLGGGGARVACGVVPGE